MIVDTRPVAIVMGSASDWPTMKAAADIHEELGDGHDDLIVSAHRTPDRLVRFATGAEDQGYGVIIAGAGGAAVRPPGPHLAGALRRRLLRLRHLSLWMVGCGGGGCYFFSPFV